jgi:hypothetical protein
MHLLDSGECGSYSSRAVLGTDTNSAQQCLPAITAGNPFAIADRVIGRIKLNLLDKQVLTQRGGRSLGPRKELGARE